MTLNYLFTATFQDGSTFTQNPEDVSTSDPTRSAFYDLLQIGKPVAIFILTGQGHTYGVDLTSGRFSRDGEPIEGDGDVLPEPHEPLRLIYYRQHRHQFNRADRQELSHEVTYCLGWQTTIGGKNYQQKTGVS